MKIISNLQIIAIFISTYHKHKPQMIHVFSSKNHNTKNSKLKSACYKYNFLTYLKAYLSLYSPWTVLKISW
jgi:hypothetical protein